MQWLNPRCHPPIQTFAPCVRRGHGKYVNIGWYVGKYWLVYTVASMLHANRSFEASQTERLLWANGTSTPSPPNERQNFEVCANMRGCCRATCRHLAYNNADKANRTHHSLLQLLENAANLIVQNKQDRGPNASGKVGRQAPVETSIPFIFPDALSTVQTAPVHPCASARLHHHSSTHGVYWVHESVGKRILRHVSTATQQ